MNIHFIAGLPRSGSTLLATILQQNPRFHAHMSGPVEEIYAATLASVSGRNTFHTFITDEHRHRVLRGVVESYYADISDTKVIFDTNRNWPLRLPSLIKIFPHAKIICCVRDIAAILNSFEHLVRKNPYEISKLWNYDPQTNVYGRVDQLMHIQQGTVGRALGALREALAGEYREKLVLVEFEDLIAKPEEIIAQVYHEINEPLFKHDFTQLSHEEEKFDAQLGLRGMHSIAEGVGLKKRSTNFILPPDILQRCEGAEFWR